LVAAFNTGGTSDRVDEEWKGMSSSHTLNEPVLLLVQYYDERLGKI
jgi:hypothetical protein